VDGAPAARFMKDLLEEIKAGDSIAALMNNGTVKANQLHADSRGKPAHDLM
jgi:hypothetical protein